MSTRFIGKGNIGGPPEYHEYPNDADPSAPHCVLRMRVYFDHSVPVGDGFEDRFGFWTTVNWWHRDAQRWSRIFQKGMRVLVDGDQTQRPWDDEGVERIATEITADCVGILPYRLASIVMLAKRATDSEPPATEPER